MCAAIFFNLMMNVIFEGILSNAPESPGQEVEDAEGILVVAGLSVKADLPCSCCVKAFAVPLPGLYNQ